MHPAYFRVHRWTETVKSSTGKYFIGLDHVRAIAVFMVFSWHFIHVSRGHLAMPPLFPLSLLTEGHVGVSLFMVLSGYLFAKLLDGKRIIYPAFLWNRGLRLVPLLVVVIVLGGVHRSLTGGDITGYMKDVVFGVIQPSLPNGGWSITAEFHFYLVLPLLLYSTRKWRYSLILVLVVALLLRTSLYQKMGQIQVLSYFTIVGRIDQFVFGILAYQFRSIMVGRHALTVFALLSFAVFYWHFDSLGGFYTNPVFPSPSSIWIYMPTAEGLAFAIAVAWYDNSFKHGTGTGSRLVAAIGGYSYSIYLFHFYVVFRLADAIHQHVVDLSNVHMAILMSIPSFLLLVPIGYLSYRFVESPFLKFRVDYIAAREATTTFSAKESADEE